MRLPLAPIVAALQAGGLKRVEGVLEWSAASSSVVLPAHFVVPLTESAAPNANAGARDQAVTAGFAVMIVLDGARRNAAGVVDDLSAAIGEVEDLLTGWRHPQAARPCDYAGGQLVSASGSVVVWQSRFTTRRHIRKAS